MRCPSEEDWLRFELGEVMVNVAKATEDHARSCPVCRARHAQHQQLLEDLGPAAPTSGADDPFVSKVMSACEKAGHLAAPSTPSRRFAPWSALALAAGLLLYFSIGPSKVDVQGTWAARGAHSRTTEGLGAEVFVVRGSQSSPVEGATLHRGDGFGVRYWKTMKGAAYLLAFAIDANGAVHWIYPAYDNLDTDPAAVPLVDGEGRTLDEVFEPDSASPGAMRIVALVSNERLTVKTVEERLGKDPRVATAADLAKIVRGARVNEWTCRWDP